MITAIARAIRNISKKAKEIKAVVNLTSYVSRDGVQYLLMPNGERRREFPKPQGKSGRRQHIAARVARRRADALTHIHEQN